MAIDEIQLGVLIDRHAAALELFARQWTDLAADVVQEAFLQLVRQSLVPNDIAAWLYQVVRNRAISESRAAQRRRKHERASRTNPSSWFESSPESKLDEEVVAEAIRLLPESDREVVVAHLWGGLTFEQIGEVTGTSSSTAHRRYLNGINGLRNLLKIPVSKREIS